MRFRPQEDTPPDPQVSPGRAVSATKPGGAGDSQSGVGSRDSRVVPPAVVPTPGTPPRILPAGVSSADYLGGGLAGSRGGFAGVRPRAAAPCVGFQASSGCL